MFVYEKLWALMKSRGLTRNDLRNNGILSPSVIAKLGKNERVSLEVIEKLCEYLDCQPSDIMEFVSDKEIDKLKTKLDTLTEMLKELQRKNGYTDEEVNESILKTLSELQSGKTPSELLEEMLHKDKDENEAEEQ